MQFDEFTVKAVGTLLIFGSALAAGMPVLLRSGERGGAAGAYPLGEALAAGVFFGAGLIHMLGDSVGDFEEAGYFFPWTELLAGTVILLMLGMEHYSARRREADAGDAAGIALLATFMLSFHSFLAGAAFGATTEVATTFVILVAVIAHKWAAAFALAVKLVRSGIGRPRAWCAFLVFVLLFPVGVIAGTAVTSTEEGAPLLEGIFTAMAAGTFIYLGTLHGLQQGILVTRGARPKEYLTACFGFALMAVVAIWT